MPRRAVIHTARLILRPPIPDDAPAIAAALADWEVTRWLSAPPWPYGIGDSRAFLSDAGTADHWAIDHGGALAGLIDTKPDLGYWLARRFWGGGLMQEAAGAVVAAHFADPDAGPLASGHFEGNDRSARVLLWLGFAYRGTGPAFARPLGREVTIRRMELTRADWHAAPLGTARPAP
ncbi:GNAT family N-acetyltransferase [Defluviimonas sp. WL0024]|uniref:GNAT family N-acetyltransferase n=1 Tax=Albidovulum salinarum TaxID=2984153 RepID=A0ABT2X6Q5_9RHOB|nr:GNAT family protein [Defluviimonas sp. WL0024]MCU9848677.1 GNAT family N-acetyltransferase [Defluviimonas sp. WL0024]